MDKLESKWDWLNFSSMWLIVAILALIAVPFVGCTLIEVGVEQGMFAAVIFLVLVRVLYGIGRAIGAIVIGIVGEGE